MGAKTPRCFFPIKVLKWWKNQWLYIPSWLTILFCFFFKLLFYFCHKFYANVVCTIKLTLAKASLLGANTVKGPGCVKVSAKPAAWTAANKVLKLKIRKILIITKLMNKYNQMCVSILFLISYFKILIWVIYYIIGGGGVLLFSQLGASLYQSSWKAGATSK